MSDGSYLILERRFPSFGRCCEPMTTRDSLYKYCVLREQQPAENVPDEATRAFAGYAGLGMLMRKIDHTGGRLRRSHHA